MVYIVAPTQYKGLCIISDDGVAKWNDNATTGKRHMVAEDIHLNRDLGVGFQKIFISTENFKYGQSEKIFISAKNLVSVFSLISVDKVIS